METEGLRRTMRRIHCDAHQWRGELDPLLRAAWETLFAAIPDAPIFYHVEWFERVCRAGLLTPWRFVHVERGRKPIGLIPFRRRSRWTADVWNPIAEDYPQLLVDPTAEREVWEAVVDWFRLESGLGMISLGHWTNPRHINLLLQIARERGAYAYIRELSPLFWINYPETWEQYLANLGPETRYNLKRRKAQLFRDFTDVSLETLTELEPAMQAFDELLDIHRRRWQDQMGSRFEDPHTAHCYRELLQWAITQRYVVIPRLKVNGRPVALATVFYLPGQSSACFACIARDRTALPAKYSPGVVLMGDFIRWAHAAGARYLDMGIGSDYYKTLLGGQERPRWEVYLARSQRTAAILAKVDPALAILRQLPGKMVDNLKRSLRRLSQQPAG